MNGQVSHDYVTKFLSLEKIGSKDLWLHVRPAIRGLDQYQGGFHQGGFLVFDDTIQEKSWTDENEIMCWHYDLILLKEHSRTKTF